jgi:hypothetical protein
LHAPKQAAFDFDPRKSTVRSENVTLKRLDELIEEIGGTRLFLKIDVQGHKKAVLEGAAGILARVVGIQLDSQIARSIFVSDDPFHSSRLTRCFAATGKIRIEDNDAWRIGSPSVWLHRRLLPHATCFMTFNIRGTLREASKFVSTRRRPAAPIATRFAGSEAKLSIAWRKPAMSPGATSKPFSPSLTISGMPPSRLAMTGRPEAMASKQVQGLKSAVVGSTLMSALA